MFATFLASGGIIGPVLVIGAIAAGLLVGSPALGQEAGGGGVEAVAADESGRAWLSVLLPRIMFGLLPISIWIGVEWVRRQRSWEKPPVSIGVAGLLGVGLILWMVPQIAVGIAASFASGVVPSVIGYGLGIGLSLVVASRLVKGPSLANVVSGLAAIGVLLPLVSVVAIISGWVARRLGYETGEVAHSTLESILEGGPTALVLIATAVVGAPIIEEIVFRLFFHGGLRRVLSRDRFGDVIKVSVIVGVVFGLIHLGAAPGHALPGLIVLGIGLGIVREGLGLWAAVVAHAAFNAWNIVLAVLVAG